MRNLHQPRLDRIQQAEVRHDPRKRLAHLVARALQVKRRRRQIHAQADAAPALAGRQLVYPVQPLDPDRRLAGVLLRQFLVVLQRTLLARCIPAPIRVMRLVVEHQPMRAAALAAAQFLADALQPGGIRLEVFHLHRLARLAGIADKLHRLAGLHHPGRRAVDAARLPLRQPVPVGDHHLAAPQCLHALRRHQLPRPIQAQVAQRRVQFAQALADGDVRANDQNRVGKPLIRGFGQTVENRPGRQHAHHRGLPAAGRHLAGMAGESAKPGGLRLLSRFIHRNRRQALAIDRSRLGQENQRFRRLDLREEQALQPILAAPVRQQFAGDRRRPVIGPSAAVDTVTPLPHPLAQRVDQGQFHLLALARVVQFHLIPLAAALAGMFRHPVEITGRPPTRRFLGRHALGDHPMPARLLEG